MRKTETFSTAADSQPGVEVHVLQGERPMARDNRTLGRFELSGIPPAPRGVPQIEVTFDIDANGILNVGAKDKGTGKEQNIVIKSSSGLEKEEVEKMKREAEAHAEEDRKARDLIEKRNKADALVYNVERTLKEHGDKISAADRTKIEDAVKEVREALKGEDAPRIEKTSEALTQASYAIAQMLYQQTGEGAGATAGAGARAGAGPDGGGGSGPRGAPHGSKAKGDDVIDAEYEVKE